MAQHTCEIEFNQKLSPRLDKLTSERLKSKFLGERSFFIKESCIARKLKSFDQQRSYLLMIAFDAIVEDLIRAPRTRHFLPLQNSVKRFAKQTDELEPEFPIKCVRCDYCDMRRLAML
jgi:hypothetical protein